MGNTSKRVQKQLIEPEPKKQEIRLCIFHDGNWFSHAVIVKLSFLPRAGDLIDVESFFPEFLSEDWEIKHNISPFCRVTEVVFSKDVIHVTLKSKFN